MPDYIVLAHDNVEMLEQLLRRLSSGDGRVFVHINACSRDARFVRLETAAPENLIFLKRRKTRWGHWNLVAATLDALDQYVEHPGGASHIVRMSGSDYPIATEAQILRTFLANPECSFLESAPFPTSFWPAEAGGFGRVDRWFSQSTGHMFPPQWMVAPGRGPRKMPMGLEPWGGWPFWAMARPMARWIVDFVKENRGVTRFFSTTRFPEEVFFQTLAHNSPLRDRVLGGAHYMDWDAGASGPKLLHELDLPAAISSGRLYARKFADADVMRSVDHILEDVREGL